MDEYIERKAAIRCVENQCVDGKMWGNEETEGTLVDAYELMDDLSDIPSADVAPVVRWVLTDEKLPPDGQDVLCWYEYFRFGEYYRMYQTFGIGYQFNGNWGGEVAQGQKAKVLAWMPLPRPPKMEGGESGESN